MKKQLTLMEPLFPMEEEQLPSRAQLVSNIAWSYSRRQTLERCVRCYYYQYFGGSKRKAKEEPDKDSLAQLKQLQSRHERTGELLHLAISDYYRKARAGNPWKPQQLAAWVRSIFSKDIAHSQTYSNGGAEERGRFPPVHLLEFYYGVPDAMDLCAQAEERMVEAVISFATNPKYEAFRQGGAKTTALIEYPFRMRGMLPCRVEGRIDLAYRDGDEITLVDWKSGKDDMRGEESLQLAVYALWAVEEYRCEPEALRICKVHFGSNSVVPFECDRPLLTAARARILQDAERMALLEGYGKDAIVEAFTPCRQPLICRNCPFLQVCPEGKELFDA